MGKLKISGVITTDPFSILAEQKRFYQELYDSRNNNNTEGRQTMIEAFLHSLNNNIPVLTEEQKLSCEGEISPEECAAALDSFQNNKTPGNDEIPIEFYRTFWPIIILNAQMNVFKKVKCLSLALRKLATNIFTKR